MELSPVLKPVAGLADGAVRARLDVVLPNDRLLGDLCRGSALKWNGRGFTSGRAFLAN